MILNKHHPRSKNSFCPPWTGGRIFDLDLQAEDALLDNNTKVRDHAGGRHGSIEGLSITPGSGYLTFAGDGRVNLGNAGAGFTAVGQLSMEFVLRPTAFSGTLFSHYNSSIGSNDAGFSLFFLPDGGLWWHLADSATTPRLNGSIPADSLVLDQWQHLVVVFDGAATNLADSIKVYINGLAIPFNYNTLTAYSSIIDRGLAFPIYIGSSIDSVGGTNLGNFDLRAMRLYHAVLTLEEIQNNYCNYGLE